MFVRRSASESWALTMHEMRQTPAPNASARIGQSAAAHCSFVPA